MECHRFCWRLATRTGRDFSGFERRLFGRKPEWQKHWRGAFAAQYYSESKRTQGEGGRGILLHTIVRGRLM